MAGVMVTQDDEPLGGAGLLMVRECDFFQIPLIVLD